ncbi:S1C family serine protease [Psychrobacillus vulpis]|uniref:Trypsin-like peptidase domain-containing protein n=1 Tax=Psychrobacillus vulpis TaxID=2325572 RepID=A0A544TGN5_9BACI|nr:serine protease [Psychrobacillus vulpis]TQR16591.1 trypsin-like peptidase domain-containing protein [Psychrobacillus vulpis]
MDPNEKQLYDIKNEEEMKDIDEEEFLELVLETQREALLKESQEKTKSKSKRPFPRWIFWLIAAILFVNTFAAIFQIYSIPAIEFLKTSAKLSLQEDIAQYKKSVVVITTEDAKGTGFSISSDGTILTNYHVVEGQDTVTVTFPEDGIFKADVVNTYPAVDLAVIKATGEDLPFLELAEQTTFGDNEPVYFIGNPLSFTSIANEGKVIDYIQLDNWNVPVVMMKAPVYRGNSGSPVLNHEGQVIGVVFATLEHDKYGKVGLFVPIDEYYNNQP